MRKERLTREATVRAFSMATEFVNNAKLVIGTPRLMKKAQEGTILEDKQMYIVPNVHLVFGKQRIRMLHSKYLIGDLSYGTFINYGLPKFVYRFICDDYYGHGDNVQYDDLKQAYLELDRVKEFTEQLETEWQRIDKNKEQIWDTLSVKGAPKYQKAFRKKFVEILKFCPNLVEMDAIHICKVMHIGAKEIEILAKFIHRNESDLNFLTVDDVEEALNLAQVRKLMES